MIAGVLRVIKCVTCRRHLSSFAMRARCVFGCGAWYCRKGQACREEHARHCRNLTRYRRHPAGGAPN